MIPSLLLDTCVLLWILEGNKKITANDEIVALLNSHQRYFSPISVAEMAIKSSLGKLDVPENLIDKIHNSGIEEWPYHHKDPFDRMLIATADTIFRS